MPASLPAAHARVSARCLSTRRKTRAGSCSQRFHLQARRARSSPPSRVSPQTTYAAEQKTRKPAAREDEGDEEDEEDQGEAEKLMVDLSRPAPSSRRQRQRPRGGGSGRQQFS